MRENQLNREIEDKVCPVCERNFDGLTDEQKNHLHKINQIAGVSMQIFNFFALVVETGVPKMTKLCTVLPDTDQQVDGVPVISLWAGFGDETPISRLEVKNNRIAELENALNEIYHSHGVSADVIEIIEKVKDENN